MKKHKVTWTQEEQRELKAISSKGTHTSQKTLSSPGSRYSTDTNSPMIRCIRSAA